MRLTDAIPSQGHKQKKKKASAVLGTQSSELTIQEPKIGSQSGEQMESGTNHNKQSALNLCRY